MKSTMNIPVNQVNRIMRAFPLVSNSFKDAWFSLSRRQVSASGHEWTSKRIKALVAYFIQLRGSLALSNDDSIKVMDWTDPNIPKWWKKSTLSYITKVTLNGTDEQFTQLVQVLQIYTYFFKDNKTLKYEEYIEFTNGLNKSYEIGPQLINTFFQKFGGVSVSWKVAKSFIKLNSHAHLIDPILFREEEYSKAELAMAYVSEHFGSLPKWLVRRDLSVAERHSGLKLNTTRTVKFSSMSMYNSDATEKMQRHFKQSESIVTWPFGYVDYRRQVNGKVRWFLAAEQWQNEMFHKYSNNMYDRLKAIPEDYTHNQEAGVIEVQKWIKQGKTCHSIDLSAATDSFPWYVTKRIIGYLSHGRKTWKTFCDLYEKLVIMPGARIRENVPGENQFIKWRVGQPLGSQPSFAMFALSHHFIVRMAFIALHKPYINNYVILGDDVVINNGAVADQYRRMAAHLKISISESKSVVSPRIAEFAGRIIQRDAFGLKYKPQAITPRTLQSAIEILGNRAIRACPPSFERNLLALIPFREYEGTNPGGFSKAMVDEFLQWHFARLKEDDGKRECDLYAHPRTVAARAALVPKEHANTLCNLSKDKDKTDFYDNSNVSWKKWKPFMPRPIYNLTCKVGRDIYEKYHTPRE